MKRTPIRRVSEKKLQANAGKMWSTISSSSKKRIQKKPRSKSEFARIYGSKQRVEFVKSLPCAACGVVGYSENAHIVTGGMGRKADYTKIVSLCGPHLVPRSRFPVAYAVGCHKTLHLFGREQFEDRYLFSSLEKAAADTESRWLEAHPKEEQQ